MTHSTTHPMTSAVTYFMTYHTMLSMILTQFTNAPCNTWHTPWHLHNTPNNTRHHTMYNALLITILCLFMLNYLTLMCVSVLTRTWRHDRQTTKVTSPVDLLRARLVQLQGGSHLLHLGLVLGLCVTVLVPLQVNLSPQTRHRHTLSLQRTHCLQVALLLTLHVLLQLLWQTHELQSMHAPWQTQVTVTYAPCTVTKS